MVYFQVETVLKDSDLVLKLLGKQRGLSLEVGNPRSTEHLDETEQRPLDGLRSLEHFDETEERPLDGLRSMEHLNETEQRPLDGLRSMEHLNETEERPLDGLRSMEHLNETEERQLEFDRRQLNVELQVDNTADEVTKKYIKTLTIQEIKLFYVTYNLDFTVFGYQVLDYEI